MFHIAANIITLCVCTVPVYAYDDGNVLRMDKTPVSNLNDNKVESENYPFRNISLPYDVRVEDLISRLKLDEVVLQLAMGGANSNGPTPAIDRLQINPFQWNNECLRGFVSTVETTCFPQPVGLAATWDPNLIKQMAKTVGLEARAIWKQFKDKGQYSDHTGLNCFAPVINILRHPLWGRNQETYGEDPYLTGIFAEHYVQGLQGPNDRYITASATCKHFDAYAGPENVPVSRFGFNAVVSDIDWHMTFLPAFQMCLGAGANGVMCSYNAINGVPNCANEKLLNDILRKQLNFTGFVISDELAIENIDAVFHYTKSKLDSAVAAIKAGVSIDLTTLFQINRFKQLKEAVDSGKLTESLLRNRLKPTFYTRMKLGEFDPDYMNPYSNVSKDVIQSWEHRELAATVASKSLVLLKNIDSFLPIYKNNLKISIIGPFIDNIDALTGDYAAKYTKAQFISPIQGIQKLTTVNVKLSHGCVGSVDKNLPKCKEINTKEILKVIDEQDIVIVTLGTGPGVEAESNDRLNLSLPGKQLDMLKLIANSTAKAIIVVLFHGGPLDVLFADTSNSIKAVISCHLSAQETGEALFRVLSGEENPAARLPNTWPKSLDQVPLITNYSMHENTYRYSTSEPLYPFGYGLSYTSFHYNGITTNDKVNVCESVLVSVTVQNVGALFGEEVAQVYLSWNNSVAEAPKLQLVAFKRIPLKPGQTTTINFIIKSRQMAVWKNNTMMILPGPYILYGGGQQPNQMRSVGSNVVSTNFIITGNETPLNQCQ